MALYKRIKAQDFERRIKKAYELLNPCRVCPRECGVNRLDKSSKAKRGFCRVGKRAVVFSYHPHFGEERCLVGRGGSGTIFFSSCNLSCVFCQNYEISQMRLGREVEEEALVFMMLDLQKRGCENINFVSPSVYIPQIIKAVFLAKKRGLELPLVYNTGGYDRVESLRLLEGIIDIYMPDIKYADDKIALKYSQAPLYWQTVKKAVREMHRQVGDLVIRDGVAKKGLLVRHLVLPNNLAGTEKVMRFLAEKISKDTFVNIMDQYYPVRRAFFYPELSRRITSTEFRQAVKIAKNFGLHRFEHSGDPSSATHTT